MSKRFTIPSIGLMCVVLGAWIHPTRAEDCNGNGIEDATEIAGGASPDCNGNGVPDECDLVFHHAGFPPAVSYPVSEFASGVVAVDLNGDHALDLAVAVDPSSSDRCLSVLMNQGDGTLAVEMLFPTPLFLSPQAVYAADFDNNGTTDIVMPSARTNQISFFVNDGSGHFAGSIDVPLGEGEPVSLATGDLNGDGDIDLAVVLRNLDKVMIVHNYDTLPFHFVPSGDYDVGERPQSVAAADLDGDDDLDLIVTNAGRDAAPETTVTLLLNDGDAHFTVSATIDCVLRPWSLVAVDLDGDGDVDLAVTNVDDDSVTILLNNGDASFTISGVHPVGDRPVSITAGDFDGDGRIDLATANAGDADTPDHTVSVLMNDGAFAAPSIVTLDTGGRPVGVIAADLDGDHHDDLVAVNLAFTDASVAVLFNSIIPPVSIDCDGNGVPDECQPDCNGNGIADACDLADHTSNDCNENTVPDECELADGSEQDCNGNGRLDSCEITDGTAEDCDGNGVLDECDLAAGTAQDCNGNGRPDACDLSDGTYADCNHNGVPDDCDITPRLVFEDAQHMLAADRPVGVAIGDLNGDGHPDMAVANWESNDVTLVLNDGDGTFSSFGTVAVGVSPQSVVAVDLDGDHDVDLVTANGGNNISILTNTGAGAFAEAVHLPAGYTPMAVVTGDFDGVNGPDLAVANWAGDDVSVFINNGDGTFSPALSYAVGDAPSALAAADLDGDGDLDLAVANETDASVSLLLNNGDGTFAAQVTYPLAAGQTPLSIQAADINGNRRIDLLVGVANGVVILRNAGLNGFVLAQTIPADAAFYLAAEDLDGDADVDLVLTHLIGNVVTVMRNHGDGSFAAALAYPVGNEPAGLAVMDLSGDGRPDVAVANRASHSVSVLLNASLPAVSADCNGNGQPDECDDAFWLAHDCNNNNVPDECEPDCNGNRKPDDCDLASGQSQDCNGNGVPDECDLSPVEFSWPTYYSAPNGASSQSVVAADFDRDGSVDLAASSGTGRTVAVYLNDGGGRFGSPVPHTTSEWPGVLAAGDLNGDHAPDLVVSTTSGGGPVGVLLNHGDGTFPATATHYQLGDRSHSVALADLDGDGDLDVAGACFYLASSAGRISLMLNNGAGTFTVPSLTYWLGRAPSSIAAGDLNGDELADLAVVNSNDGNVSVVINTGSATFAPRVNYSVGDNPGHVTLYDLDGDNDLDLVVTNRGSNSVSLLLNAGDGTFAPAVSYSVGTAPVRAAFGDLDGDGISDLAVTNYSTYDVSLLLNQGQGRFAAVGTTVIQNWPVGGGAPTGVALADLNGDGALDMAVASAAATGLAVLMNERVAAIAEDCNENGIPDSCDIQAGTSLDRGGDGVPDECQWSHGDFDGDGDADDADFAHFLDCVLGPAIPQRDPACADAKLDADEDVDQDDFGIFQRCYSGAGTPVDPRCAN